MEVYLREPEHVERKRKKWSKQKSSFEALRDSILQQLSTLPETQTLCKLLCQPETAVSFVAPGMVRQVRLLEQSTKQSQEDLKQQLLRVNKKIEKLETRITHLESEDFRAQLVDRAVVDAVSRLEVLFEEYKRNHAAVHDALNKKIKELTKKQRITVQDVKELAEEVEEAMEPPQPESVLPRDVLLEQIRKGVVLRSPPPPSVQVTPEERETLMDQLAKALSGIRASVQPEPEEEEEEE